MVQSTAYHEKPMRSLCNPYNNLPANLTMCFAMRFCITGLLTKEIWVSEAWWGEEKMVRRFAQIYADFIDLSMENLGSIPFK